MGQIAVHPQTDIWNLRQCSRLVQLFVLFPQSRRLSNMSNANQHAGMLAFIRYVSYVVHDKEDGRRLDERNGRSPLRQSGSAFFKLR